MPNQRTTWANCNQPGFGDGHFASFCTIFPTQQAGDALLNKACLTKHSTIWVWLKIGYPLVNTNIAMENHHF